MAATLTELDKRRARRGFRAPVAWLPLVSGTRSACWRRSAARRCGQCPARTARLARAGAIARVGPGLLDRDLLVDQAQADPLPPAHDAGDHVTTIASTYSAPIKMSDFGSFSSRELHFRIAVHGVFAPTHMRTAARRSACRGGPGPGPGPAADSHAALVRVHQAGLILLPALLAAGVR